MESSAAKTQSCARTPCRTSIMALWLSFCGLDWNCGGGSSAASGVIYPSNVWVYSHCTKSFKANRLLTLLNLYCFMPAVYGLFDFCSLPSILPE